MSNKNELLSKWMSNASNTIGIIAGIPVIFGLAATAWTFIYSKENLLTLIMLFVGITMIMWFYIGIVWLVDRKVPKKPLQTLVVRDCSWGLSFGQSSLIHNSNEQDKEWIYIINFVNNLQFPIIMKVENVDLVLEKMIGSPYYGNHDNGVVIAPKGLVISYLAGFEHNMISKKRKMSGSITILIKYGHPEDGYSRDLFIKQIFHMSVYEDSDETPKKYALAIEPLEHRDTPIIDFKLIMR